MKAKIYPCNCIAFFFNCLPIPWMILHYTFTAYKMTTLILYKSLFFLSGRLRLSPAESQRPGAMIQDPTMCDRWMKYEWFNTHATLMDMGPLAGVVCILHVCVAVGMHSEMQAVTSRVLPADRWTKWHRQKIWLFLQPVAAVINWDCDPQQQPLLLELWALILTCHNAQAVSIRKNDPFQWSLHGGHWVSGFGDKWRESATICLLPSVPQTPLNVCNYRVVSVQSCNLSLGECLRLHV